MIRAEGESESAKLISDATKQVRLQGSLGQGLLEQSTTAARAPGGLLPVMLAR